MINGYYTNNKRYENLSEILSDKTDAKQAFEIRAEVVTGDLKEEFVEAIFMDYIEASEILNALQEGSLKPSYIVQSKITNYALAKVNYYLGTRYIYK